MNKKIRKILIVLCLNLMVAVSLFSLGIAFIGGVRGIGLLGIWFFLTFGIFIVLAQLIPASILLASFVGTIFSSFRRGEMPIRIA